MRHCGVAFVVVAHAQSVQGFHLLVFVFQFYGELQGVLQVYGAGFELLGELVGVCDFETDVECVSIVFERPGKILTVLQKPNGFLILPKVDENMAINLIIE